MKMKMACTGLALVLLMGSSAMAQDSTAPGTETPTAETPTTEETAAKSQAADTTASTDRNQGGLLLLIVPEMDQAQDQTQPVTAEQIYQGWRAEALLDADVYGPNNNQLGEIEDLIIGTDGKIVAAVVEGGGFLEIGDARFRIPWEQVKMRAGDDDAVQVPLTEETAEAYGLYDKADWVATGPREFRLTELIGDRVALRNGLSAGYVNDVVFSQDGKLLSVLVNPGVRPYGLYAYPWYGYGYRAGYAWDPGQNYYALPVTDIDAMRNGVQIDAKRLGDMPFDTAG